MTRTNPWLSHLKAYHAKHPELTYKEAMQKAKMTYKKHQSGKGYEEFIDPIADFSNNLLTTIVGSPELQAQRTQARIDRRTAKDAERSRRRKAVDDRGKSKVDARNARRRK